MFDRDNRIAEAFGLVFSFTNDLREVYLGLGVDLTKANGNPDWTLPMPARYIVDADGTIRYARVAPDYTVRPEPDETVEALEALSVRSR